jgi:hypothetical protein
MRSARASTSHHGRRCQRDCAHLRGMPILRLQDEPPSARPPEDPHHVAFCRVGAGHCQAPAKGTRGLHPPASHH